MIDKNFLIKQLNILLKDKSIVSKKIEEYPAGILKVKMNKNSLDQYCRYYIEYDSKDKRGRKNRTYITKDEQLIKTMAKKRYYQEMLELIEKNISAFGNVGEISNVDIDMVMERIPKPIQQKLEFDRNVMWKLPKDPHRAKVLLDWVEQPYVGNPKHPEHLSHTTSTGQMVRSKSEALIYEKLLSYKVAFKYETPLAIGGKIVYPDFTIMRIDNKIFYWEHAGCCFMDSYRDEFNWKLKQYEKAGIVLWDNLIVTFDDINGNIDVRDIESAIQNKLLI